MTLEKNQLRHIGQRRKVLVSMGAHAFTYTGIIISFSLTHITIKDELEGLVDIPLVSALIKEVR